MLEALRACHCFFVLCKKCFAFEFTPGLAVITSSDLWGVYEHHCLILHPPHELVHPNEPFLRAERPAAHPG